MNQGRAPYKGHIQDNPPSHYVNRPPKVFDASPDARFNRERHDEVLQYARAVIGDLARDSSLATWHRICADYSSWYRGSESIQPDERDLELRSVNLCKVAIDLKVAKLFSDRLKLHYMPTQPTAHDMSVAVSRWFDFHERMTDRRELQKSIEKMVPIYGSCGALILPRVSYEESEDGLVIPAFGEKLLPHQMFFDPREDDSKRSVFVTREVTPGRLEDQKHRALLKKRKADSFMRGSATSMFFSTSYPTYTTHMLGLSNDTDVEIIRIWVKDLTEERVPIYNYDEAAHTEANEELENILLIGSMPTLGENHFNHYTEHMVQAQKLAQEPETPPDSLIKLEAHAQDHIRMMNEGDQKPDGHKWKKIFPKGWRYIKAIGDQVVFDGTSPLDHAEPPVILFRNIENTESSIGMSDMDALINLNRDFNALLSDKMEHSYNSAFPKEYLPERMRDPEVYKPGEPFYVENPAEVGMIGYVAPPPYSKDGNEMIGMFMSFIEIVGGANATNLGAPAQSRPSGIDTAQRQNAASARYTTTQEYLGDGWKRYAKFALSQWKQYGDEELAMQVAGPEYEQSVMLLKSDINPYAHMEVTRVPRDTDFQTQEGQQLLQMANAGRAFFGLPPQVILDVLASEGNAGAVSRITGKFKKKIEEDENAKKEYEASLKLQAMGKEGEPQQ